MQEPNTNRLVEILLVEDSPTDVMITREAFAHHKVKNPMRVAEDGMQAIEYLRSALPLPGLIILDLNLPKLSGREVLEIIKQDELLKVIPVVILTTSKAEEDIVRSYGMHANCYITKPVDFNKFVNVVQTINEFWFEVVTLPPAPTHV